MTYFAHSSAVIDEPVEIGDGTKVWHFCHISKGARIGSHSSLGQNCYVGNDVIIGANVKIQNNVSVYTGTIVEDDVFLGPSCVLTNVSNPRSQVKRQGLYEQTLLKKGSSVGANATIVCGITIGRYAFIAAGAVVTHDVPDYGLVRGVPGKLCGWMSRHGHTLEFNDEGLAVCPESRYRYRRTGDLVHCLDLPEDEPLPPPLAVGTQSYDTIKTAGRAKHTS